MIRETENTIGSNWAQDPSNFHGNHWFPGMELEGVEFNLRDVWAEEGRMDSYNRVIFEMINETNKGDLQ